MNVFISQPMNGLTDFQIKEKRNTIIKAIAKKFEVDLADIAVVNPIERTIDPSKVAFNDKYTVPNRLTYLGATIADMPAADIIVFSDDYRSASGCLVERMVTMLYGEYYKYWKFYKYEDGELVNLAR